MIGDKCILSSWTSSKLLSNFIDLVQFNQRLILTISVYCLLTQAYLQPRKRDRLLSPNCTDPIGFIK